MKTITHNGTEYRSGEPPSLGWWPTLVEGGSLTWIRWWNGFCWSVGADARNTTEVVVLCAVTPAPYPDWQIFWADRPASWPERSRT